MRSFNPTPTLDGRQSLYLGIAASLRRSIERGQLEQGGLLPSTRELASRFGVHRHTVATALDLLVAEGLLEAQPRRGFQVLREQSTKKPRPMPTRHAFPGFRLVRENSYPPLPAVSTVPHPLHSATPDASLMPHAELRSAYAHALRRQGRELYDIDDERGLPRFRAILADYLRRNRGLFARDSLITHGSQEAISLVAQALLRPGDWVAVEDPGFPPAFQAFRACGARLARVSVDAHGLDITALAKLVANQQIRLIYTTPAHQFPTTVSLSAARRQALLELSAQHAIPILEDDYDHEYQYRGLPLAPLAAHAGAEHVIYVASLSKLVAPGVRLGCVVASEPMLKALAGLRRLTTRGHDPLPQAALAEWMNDGGLERHLRRARRAYGARRDALLEALSPAVESGRVELSTTDGGLALWARFLGVDSLKLAERARAHGILVLPEQLLRVSPRQHDGVRLSFSRVAPEHFRNFIPALLKLGEELAPRRRRR